MQENFRYGQRKVEDWIERIETGKLALADFQRSFVWDKKKAENYVKAILDGRPVGLYLILQVADRPQFGFRPFHEEHNDLPRDDGPVEDVEELVLDGQQRLTSLFQALRGNARSRLLVKIKGLREAGFQDLLVEGVEREPRNGGRIDEAVNLYDRDCVPLDILFESGEEDEDLTRLEKWCHEIAESRQDVNGIKLKKRIEKFFHVNFFMRDLHYCVLNSSTDTSTAADIFIDVNESSMKISRFDVAVAVARGSHDMNLRSEIKKAVGSQDHTNLLHYFDPDEESWIPDIGEWMLKVACLHAGKAPREGDYIKGLEEYLLAPDSGDGAAGMDSIFVDLSWALARAAELGAATKRTLPSWPPLHVMAALRKAYIGIQDPVRRNAARSLLEAYYWRCLFTNRHERDANQRLYDDFDELKKAFTEIEKGEPVSIQYQIFEDEDHPLYGRGELMRKAGWISRSRLGRAVLSVAMTSSGSPVDWVTGEKMNADHVRTLEKAMNLDRHHIFPKRMLKDAGADETASDSALNGVYLDGRTNGKLSRHDPRDYVSRVIEESSAAGGGHIDEEEMRDRVESHLVPYDHMVAAGDVRARYRKFLEKRAQMVAEEVQKRTARAPK